MAPLILALHNSLRWLVLVLAVVALVRALKGINGGEDYATGARRALALFVMSVHAQLIVGVLLYFTSPLARQAMANMGATMKDAGLRNLVVEHPTLMLLAVIAATLSAVIARRGPDDTVRHRRAAIGIMITLGLMLTGIPWQRPLLPQF